MPDAHPVREGGPGFVDIMIVNVLCDLLFGHSQPLKLTGDQYVGIWENKIKLNKFLIILKRTKIKSCD